MGEQPPPLRAAVERCRTGRDAEHGLCEVGGREHIVWYIEWLRDVASHLLDAVAAIEGTIAYRGDTVGDMQPLQVLVVTKCPRAYVGDLLGDIDLV